ncbi:hypothetical protein ACFE04_001064 [Oxalis oulophora]
MEDDGGGAVSVTNNWVPGDFSPEDEFGFGGDAYDDGGGDDDCIDLDLIFKILGEEEKENHSNDSSQKSSEICEFEYLSQKPSFTDDSNHEKSQPHNGCSEFERGSSFRAPSQDLGILYPSHHSDASKDDSADSNGYNVKQEHNSNYSSQSPTTEHFSKDLGYRDESTISGFDNLKAPGDNIPGYVGISSMEANKSLQNEIKTEDAACQNSSMIDDFEYPYMENHFVNMDPTFDFFPNQELSQYPDEIMTNVNGGSVDYLDVDGQHFKCEEESRSVSPVNGYSSSNADYGFNDELRFSDEDSKKVIFAKQGYTFLGNKEKLGVNMAFKGVHDDFGMDNEYSLSGTHFDLNNTLPHTSIKQQFDLDCIKEEKAGALVYPSLNSHFSKVTPPESIHSNSTNYKFRVDHDDDDVCIIEDMSHPARYNQYRAPEKSLVTRQHTTSNGSVHYSGTVAAPIKPLDERIIFRAALQKIALSWMVQKETASLHCSGGILADDQGLGKTISTIALILKERPPSLKADFKDVKKEESETLNLDEDDGGVTECSEIKKETLSLKKNMKQQWLAKGRPNAGTLVVCPTSVLRQWAEELQTKVHSEAKLSVLVYHGSNRTKDPADLAKYDVVLTTYSIVSNEVPKQPLVDKDENEKGNSDVTKKRKYPHPSSDKKSSKHKKKMDGESAESICTPLAKVAWFRVVLDEAQSIKNHRTQVARACWGLRAKRRWCLSGTPIQNAIDDLYSYFRFLKYDPYAVYKSFCESIKVPINKSPARGYKKLQAVLKTIMLRRTKGTLLDGKPIIILPPKVVELKQVEFTAEERDFYEKLETDSRAQFKKYADEGTVKQNYVNILLMLLRLRQACDHPLLVKGFDSSTFEKISVEMAKKLPLEKKFSLLNCLEASLALCGICKDPPEDAVVTTCGHVFCNQCICERVFGDENHCPATNCKIQLRASNVFSKTTLISSLSDQENMLSPMDPVGPCSTIYDSSKIRVALQVLLSLSKPKDFTSTINHNTAEQDNTAVDKKLEDSVKVVGEKAIVFSQWTRMLDLLEISLKSSPIQYRRLDGTMSVAARDKAVKDFNTDPQVTVIIMSLKAASLGLNMVAASCVLMLDLWWNPTTEDQAIDRAHRIGQTRPVTVFRLTVENTVEDRILALQKKKREMVASAFGEDGTNNQQTRLTVEDLSYLFRM